MSSISISSTKKFFVNTLQHESPNIRDVEIRRANQRDAWNRRESRADESRADSRDFTPRPWFVISRQLLARQEVRHHTCALALTFLHNVKSGTGRVGRSSLRPTIAKEQWNDESFFGSQLGWHILYRIDQTDSFKDKKNYCIFYEKRDFFICRFNIESWVAKQMKNIFFSRDVRGLK